MDILKVAAELGAPCLLAAMIFIIYRIDRNDSNKILQKLLIKDQETRNSNTEALTKLKDASHEQTQAIRDLSQAIRGMNGHH